MIELEVETNVAGRAAQGQSVHYMLGGGTLDGDTSAGHHFGLQAPKVGDRMLVLLVDTSFDLDPGPGVLEVNAYELFPIDADGRIITPNASEQITTQDISEMLRDIVPEATPAD